MRDGPPGSMGLRLVAAAGLLAVATGTGFDTSSWQLRSSGGDAGTGSSAVGAAMAAWQVNKIGAMVSEFSRDVCTPINVYCANAKCCSGLVCEPVLDGSGVLQPLCAVPDASQMDGNACYDDEHICYFHHQCCSGRCIDDDGDTIFTCEVNASNPHRKPFMPRGDTGTKKSVHYGPVDDHIPTVAIILLVVGVVGVLGAVVHKVTRKHLDQWNEAVDKIPPTAWNGGTVAVENRYNGWYFDGGELSEKAEIGGYQAVPGSDELEGPPVPPRDYSDDADAFTDIATTPPRPAVDYTN